MKRYLITGANRGLGLAYTRQLLADGHQVLATARPSGHYDALTQLKAEHPGSLLLYITYLVTESECEELVKKIEADVNGLDVLIHNAGVLTDGETIESVQLETLTDHYLINAAVPVILTQACLPLLKRGNDATVVNMSSSFASIHLKNPNMPYRYSYSMSKAAINMFTKTLAGELQSDGITVVAIHPGWVRTDLGGPEAKFSPEEAAEAVTQTIAGLTLAQTGKYLTWDGRELPW